MKHIDELQSNKITRAGFFKTIKPASLQDQQKLELLQISNFGAGEVTNDRNFRFFFLTS